MKDFIEQYDSPVDQRQVDIIHILNDGQVIVSKKELEAVAEKFTWVNHNQIARMVLELRPQTDSSRKSIIAIFENHEIKTFVNISKNFTKYNLLYKSTL